MTKLSRREDRAIHHVLPVIMGVLLFLGGIFVQAESIDSTNALLFAQNWLAAADNPLGTGLDDGRAFADVEPIQDADGTLLAWYLPMSPKGFMIIAPDDRISPVVMVSKDGKFDNVDANPLRALLVADITARLDAVEAVAPDEQTRGTTTAVPESITANRATWAQFTGEQTRSAGTNVVSEIRVDSFVKSHWAQTGGIYNYYTPTIYGTYYTFEEPGNPENISCGCVATAIAQILRYYQWPQEAIGTKQGECTIFMRDKFANPPSVTITKYLRGGDGQGGKYNWDLMSYNPSPADTEETFKQIGALCFDAGLSVGMSYNNDHNGKESAADFNSDKLVKLFGYTGADGNSSLEGGRAALDARRPLAVSISQTTSPSGHAIVCDGYGKLGGRWYYHLNMGWSGADDGWYNFDENFTTESSSISIWSKSISIAYCNVYRKALQANEDAESGKIISGRVVDANGIPVAGVDVKIVRLDDSGSEKYTQHMLAWYDPIKFDIKNEDGIYTPGIKVSDATESKDPTSDYRHTTDANGIWAVDKVEDGKYRIVLTKDGLDFAGKKTVTISANSWGNDFIATATDLLTLKNWWIDESLLYLEFNHAVGDVNIDLSKVKLDDKALAGATAYITPASKYIVIDLTKLDITSGITLDSKLITSEGFLTVDTDGDTTQEGINDGPIVPVPVLNETTQPADNHTAPIVSAITRKDLADFDTAANYITFHVEGSNLSDITISDFRLTVTKTYAGEEGTFDAKSATNPPAATISSWDATTGILAVQVGKGDGYIRLDYVPASGTSFLTGESFHIDNIGPAIISSELGNTNLYVDITWNESVGKKDTLADTHPLKGEASMLCYTGTEGSYAIWSEAKTDADGQYNADVDTLIAGIADTKLDDGQAQTKQMTGDYATVKASYSIMGIEGDFEGIEGDFEVGRFVVVDVNKNGKYDAGECLYPQIINNVSDLKNNPTTDATYDDEYTSNSNLDQYLLIGGKKPEGTYPVVPVTSLFDKIAFYNTEGKDLYTNPIVLTGTDNAAMLKAAEAFQEWANKTAFWLDYGPCKNDGYQSASDRLLCGEEPAEGTAGTELDTTGVYYIDVDGSGAFSSADFLWRDATGGTDAVYDEGKDTVLTKVGADGFDWRAAPEAADLTVLLHTNGGTITSVNVAKISPLPCDAASADTAPDMTCASDKMRVWLAYTPELENEKNTDAATTQDEVNKTSTTDLTTYGIPAGVETIEVKPYAEKVFDKLANAASENNTTGELQLYDSRRPRITNITMGYDNYSLNITFNKRIYGNSDGIANFIALGKPPEEYEVLTPKNFTITVTYDNGKTKVLTLGENSNEERSVIYEKGANFCILDFVTKSTPDNRKLLDAANGNPDIITKKKVFDTDVDFYAKPVSITVEFKNIYDFNGNPLVEKSVVVPLWPEFTPGYPSLPPPMFSNYARKYPDIYEYPNDKPDDADSLPWTDETTSDWQYKDIDILGNCGCTVTTQKAEKDGTTYIRKKYTNVYKTSYTQTQLSKEQTTGEFSYIKYDKDYLDDPEKTLQFKDSLSAGAETTKTKYSSAEAGCDYYGVWYRDLDGDGRIDAVDLNFRNPYNNYNASRQAELKVGSIAGFTVWAQNCDPEDYDDPDPKKNYYPADKEAKWDTIFKDYRSNSYPLNNYAAWDKLGKWTDSEPNFKSNWKEVHVTDHTTIEDESHRFTTLRLNLDQNDVSPRTNGDRFICVSYKGTNYSSPIASLNKRSDNTYDWRVQSRLGDIPMKDWPNIGVDDVNRNYFTDEDELAGLCWVYYATEADDKGTKRATNAYFIVDSFGPVMAWDGAAPVPISVVARRSNAYPRAGETTDKSGYDYYDVVFSEPIAYAADAGMEGCGYKIRDPKSLEYGPWGVEKVSDCVLRFKVNTYTRNLREFSFKGTLYDCSAGLRDHNYAYRKKMQEFSGCAIGVTALDSRYQVISQATTADMFIVDSSDAHITANGRTMPLSLNAVTLKTYSQGGGLTLGTAKWYCDRTCIGNDISQMNHKFTNFRGKCTYSLGLNPITQPGAGLYGAITALRVRNDYYADYYGQGKHYATAAVNTFYASEPISKRMGYSTSTTPSKAVLSGPVYAMVKASPVIQPYGTSRITAGTAVNVIGLDVAGSADYKLSRVTVRFVDTSHGQFDPEIDFKPLTDDSTSGVLLYDINANSVVKISLDGLDWSEWRINEEGLLYRELTLKPLAPVAIPSTQPETGLVQSFDFYIQVFTSEAFNLGDSFYAEIPDDGVSFGTFSTVDSMPTTWATPDGAFGFPFTDSRYRDRNYDARWAHGEAITSYDDPVYPMPITDGGYPYYTNYQSTRILASNGVNIKNIYYSKKNWATNPQSSPFFGIKGITSTNPFADLLIGTDIDLDYNTSYAPGDDVWYDIGGTLGVYDVGIDIPIIGNADKFVLPWQTAESGTRSAQYRAAAPAVADSVSTKYISAPSNGPVAMVGLDMQDAGRGFGPRFILNDTVLVENISKNITGKDYSITFTAAAKAEDGTDTPAALAWDGGDPVDIPITVGGRAILTNHDNSTCIVIRRLADDDGNLKGLPPADCTILFVVSRDVDVAIQQPVEIAGVRILAAGRGNKVGSKPTLKRTSSSGTVKLSWDNANDDKAVDVTDGGIFALNPRDENYIIVQVSQAGAAASGSESESLAIYESEGRDIASFMNISGLEIMGVSDMVKQGYYTFSYDGVGNLSWGNGDPVNVSKLKTDDFELVYGDGEIRYDNGVKLDYPRNFVIVRRTAAALPSTSVCDSLFINQSQLLRVAVTLTNIHLGSHITTTHFKPLSNTPDSGISLWWDANADGVFNVGADKFVKLLETPVLTGGADTYTTTLIPDPEWLTAWLSCAQDAATATRGYNFFVCVNTTIDMSYGDKFSVAAKFYEPTEPDYDDGGICFASASSGTVTCVSITNTVFSKLTTSGQTIDADTTVGLASIDHFFGTDIPNKSVYMTAVKITVHKPAGSSFNPDTAFTAMDATDAAARGIMLYADTNDNGIFDATIDTVIPCAIEVTAENEDNGPWTYTLRPESSGGDSLVPNDDDDLPDHFIAINLADSLPFGVSFYAHMAKDAVTYNTGAGSASSTMKTDTLTSTINSEYADLLDSSMVTATSGLVVNKIGTGVASKYHKITLGYNVSTNVYTLSWNGYTVDIDITAAGTYTLGKGNEYIEVTFDPVTFFREDTLVASSTGRPDPDIELGKPLISVARLKEGTGLVYYDANANGAYDDGESIADSSGQKVYGDDYAKAVTRFTAADGLSFWDKDDNKEYTLGESIFHDTDNTYSLPWMAWLVDADNYVTAGQGGAAAGVNTTTELKDAATVSPPEDEIITAGLYLYYIDAKDDGLGYKFGEDIIVCRTVVAADGETEMPALKFDSSTDHVILDPAYATLEDKDKYTAPTEGTLCQFDTMDYLKFRSGGNAPDAFEQGDSLFLSFKDKYTAPSFTWTIRVDKERRIRRYNENAPAPFNEPEYALTAIAGLDIANSDATDVKLTSLKVRFVNKSNFTIDDLRKLTTDTHSGVQLWRDLDGNGIFNPQIDKLVSLASAPTLSSDGTNYIIAFSPSDDNEITNPEVDGIYDFFVVVQPDPTANNKLNVDDGDQFSIIIKNTDVVLNKTLNQTASLFSDVITIDSRAPQLDSEARISDSDKDGFLESIVMSFDEKLRPGMLDDPSIWSITDTNSSAVFNVVSATLSDDYRTVTLTLSGADTGTSTGTVSLIVKYNPDNALLDWAGNPVDFRLDSTLPEDTTNISNYIASGDSAAPRIVHSGITVSTNTYDEKTIHPASDFYFHDRNQNGTWDPGEDIWQGTTATYSDPAQRVWNGGGPDPALPTAGAAWTTKIGYTGKPLTNVYFCDANDNKEWDFGEFTWIDKQDSPDPSDPDKPSFSAKDKDTPIPLNRTEEIAVIDRDSNGKIDAIEVWFSEKMDDITMAGADSTTDSFTPSKWSLTGYTNLKAWRKGLDSVDFSDGLNDNHLFISFDESTDLDSGNIPALGIDSGETLADIYGNKLNEGTKYASGTLVLTDHAKPILISAKSSKRVVRAEGAEDTGGAEGAEDNYYLPADTVLTFSFSEPLTQYIETTEDAHPLADFKIKRNGNEFSELSEIFTLNKASIEVTGNKITVTLTDKIDRWAASGVTLEITENDDSAFGDAVGNPLSPVTDFPIDKIDASVPTEFIYPTENQYIRDDSDALAVQVDLGDLHPDKVTIASWSLVLTYKADTDPKTIGSDKGNDILEIVDDKSKDTAVFKEWRKDDIYAYTLTLTITYTVDGKDINKEVKCNFISSKNEPAVIKEPAVNDGPGIDTDEYLSSATTVDANWSDFSAAIGLPEAKKYNVSLIKDSDSTVVASQENVEATTVTLGQDASLTLVLDAKYHFEVTALDSEGFELATAISDGFTAVEKLTDTTPPVMNFVKNIDSNGNPLNTYSSDNPIETTTSTTSLYAKWKATDDVAVTQYKYRVVKGGDSLEWSEDDSKVTTPRRLFGYAKTASGKLIMFGGHDGASFLKSVETYDPSTTLWSPSANPPLNTARGDFGFATGTNYIVAAGGMNDDEVLDSIEFTTLDSTTTEWSTAETRLETARYGARLLEVKRNTFWLIGGRNAEGDVLNSIEKIEFIPGTPLDVTVKTIAPELSVPRTNFEAICQRRSDGKTYVLIVAGEGDDSSASNVVDVINVDTLATSTRNLETPRRAGFALVAVPDLTNSTDNIWVMGGFNDENKALGTVERIDADGNISPLANMTQPRAQFQALWVPSSEYVLAAAGFGETLASETNTVEIAQRTGAWTEVSKMKVAAGHAMFALALAGSGDTERLVAFGGLSNGAYSCLTESRKVIEVVKGWEETTNITSVVDNEGNTHFETSVSCTNLKLEEGESYIFEVKAGDAKNNWSTIMASKDVLVDTVDISATIACDDLPEDGGTSAALNYSITIGGKSVATYSYSIDDGSTWSEFTSVNDPLKLNLELGPHKLMVIGCTKDGKEQPESNASSISWTIVEPVVSIISGLPDDNLRTIETTPNVIVGGTGLDGYVWKLSWKLSTAPEGTEYTEIADWSEIVGDFSTKVPFDTLTVGNTYKLELKGVVGDITGTTITSRTWSVIHNALSFEFAPPIPETGIAAATPFTVTISDATGADNVDCYKWVLRDASNNVVQGKETDEVDINTPISLEAPETGSYTLEVFGGTDGTDGTKVWQSIASTKTFTVANAEFASFSPELKPSPTTNYTVTVNLNGLTAYKYQLEPDPEIKVQEPDDSEDHIDLSFDIGPLSNGTHTLKLWGTSDGGTTYQSVPDTATIWVTSSVPVGDKLTAELVKPAASVHVVTDGTDGNDIDFTLTFSNILMTDPTPDNFTVTNGTVKDIVKDEVNAKVFTITVTPDALDEGVNQQYVTITLNAEQVYDATTGNGNGVSNTASVLVFHEPVLTMSLDAYEVDDSYVITDTPIDTETGVNTGDFFAVKVLATSDYAFLGGDFILTYDTNKFRFVSPLTSGDNQLINAEKAIQAPYNEIKNIGEWVENPGKIRLGGAVKTATASDTPVTYAILVFKAIFNTDDTDAGADAGANTDIDTDTDTDTVTVTVTDFVLSAGNSGLLLDNLGLLEPEDASVKFGKLQMPVTFVKSKVSLALSSSSVDEGDTANSVDEGGNAKLTVKLDRPLEADVTFTISNGDTSVGTCTIKAGAKFSESLTVNAEAADNLLTGDRTTEFKISDSTDKIFVDYSDASAILTSRDIDAKNIKFSLAADNVVKDCSINEGKSFHIYVDADSSAASDTDIVFNFTVSGVSANFDYTFASTFQLPAGEKQSVTEVKTYRDDMIADAKTMTIEITGFTVNGNPTDFEAATLLKITINNIDTVELDHFLSNYGKDASDPNYDPSTDFDEDGDTDYDDLMMLINKWTIGSPVASIFSGLPKDGLGSTVTTPNVVVGGTGLDGYVWKLSTDTEDTDWSEPVNIFTNVPLGTLTVGNTYTLQLKGVVGDTIGTTITSRTWSVIGNALSFEFDPPLPNNGPAAATPFTVTISDATGADNVDCYKWVLRDASNEVVQGNETDEVDINTPISLKAPETGSYTLEVFGRATDTQEWQSQSIAYTKAFTVANAKFDHFSPDLKPSPTTNYTVTVNLNGLTAYKYQLDSDPEIKVQADSDDQINLSFDTGQLSNGTHTLKLWGTSDGVTYQSVPDNKTILVTSSVPVGDKLTATFAEPAASVTDGTDIDFTLTFSNTLLAEPTADNFTVTNGTVKGIVKDKDDAKVFTVTVTPDALDKDVNQQYVTITLNAEQVYDATTGNGNGVSNTASVLVFHEPVLTMSLDAYEVDDSYVITDTPIDTETGVNTGDFFAVRVLATSDYAFLGGDFILTYDTNKFRFVSPLTSVENQLIDAEKAIQAPYNEIKNIGEWSVNPDDNRGTIRLGGVAITATASDTPVSYAILVFKAIFSTDDADAGAGADTDFVLSTGTSGLLLDNLGLLKPEDESVKFGTLQMPVTFAKSKVSLALNSSSVDEGGTAKLTVKLDRPLEDDVTFTISNGDTSVGTCTVKAGALSSESLTVDAEPKDNQLTGDRTTEFKISDSTDKTFVDYTDASATLTSLDIDAKNIKFSLAEGKNEVTIKEEESFRIYVDAGEDSSAASDIVFNFTVSGVSANSDYTFASDFQLPAGKKHSETEVNTYRDNMIADAKTMTIDITGFTVNGKPAASHYFKPATLTIIINNIDTVTGDFTGDDTVDFDDLAHFLSNYGKESDDNYDLSTDFNGDGHTDFDDLMILISNWTREGTRSVNENSTPTVTFTVREAHGTSIVSPGDTVTIQIYISSDNKDGVAAARTNVNYTSSYLKFVGDFSAGNIVNTEAFDMIISGYSPTGTLDDANGLISKLGATDNNNNNGSPACNGDAPVLFAEFQLLVSDDATGTLEVSLDELVATAYTNLSSQNGTLNVIAGDPLVFRVSNSTDIPEFRFAFESSYSDATRATSDELVLGMKKGASFQYVPADGDDLAFKDSPTYTLYFNADDRDEILKSDIRGLSDSEVWAGVATVPAGHSLTLDWSCNLDTTQSVYSMPDYFNFTFRTYDATGAYSEFDMRTATSNTVTFTADDADSSFNFEIRVETAAITLTYSLNCGWNLIGIPFKLNSKSIEALSSFETMVYDTASAAYVTNGDTFTAGQGCWVFVPRDQMPEDGNLELTLSGDVSTDESVTLAKGWNLVSPLYSTTAVYTNPADGTTITTVWLWEKDGYKRLEPDEAPLINTGYWLYSSEEKTIWPTTTK